MNPSLEVGDTGIETATPLLTFDEARRFHLLVFAETTIEQRIEWLGDMLELRLCA